MVTGEIVKVEPDFVISHDNAAVIAKTFSEIGVSKIHEHMRHVFVLDHCVPAANEKLAQNHKDIRQFVSKEQTPRSYDIHQVMVEEGFALPGTLIVGSDSHSTTYGVTGALAMGIGRSEMAVHGQSSWNTSAGKGGAQHPNRHF